jgi:hypothetical protein
MDIITRLFRRPPPEALHESVHMDNEVSRVVKSGLLTEFVSNMRDVWNHSDWGRLRDRLRAKGHMNPYDNAVRLLLEAEEARFWAGIRPMDEEINSLHRFIWRVIPYLRVVVEYGGIALRESRRMVRKCHD